MLQIRPEQMEAFRAAAEKDFHRRLLVYVRRQFAARCSRLSHADIVAAVDACIAGAKAHGLATEREIAAFVDLAFILGTGFEAEPWARQILAGPGAAPDKLERLKQGALRRLRERRG